jgi:hypothetical protein
VLEAGAPGGDGLAADEPAPGGGRAGGRNSAAAAAVVFCCGRLLLKAAAGCGRAAAAGARRACRGLFSGGAAPLLPLWFLAGAMCVGGLLGLPAGLAAAG